MKGNQAENQTDKEEGREGGQEEKEGERETERDTERDRVGGGVSRWELVIGKAMFSLLCLFHGSQ